MITVVITIAKLAALAYPWTKTLVVAFSSSSEQSNQTALNILLLSLKRVDRSILDTFKTIFAITEVIFVDSVALCRLGQNRQLK